MTDELKNLSRKITEKLAMINDGLCGSYPALVRYLPGKLTDLSTLSDEYYLLFGSRQEPLVQPVASYYGESAGFDALSLSEISAFMSSAGFSPDQDSERKP